MPAVARPPVIVANAKPPVQRKPKGPGLPALTLSLNPPPDYLQRFPERKWTGREDEILISAVSTYSPSTPLPPLPSVHVPHRCLHFSRWRKDQLDKDRRAHRGTIEQGLPEALDPFPQSHAQKG